MTHLDESLEKPSPSRPSRFAWHRRLYLWVLSFAHHPHSLLALFILSFTESSFFPIAPDPLQMALTLERPEKAWRYAGVNAIASVLGGCAGYLIGMWIWEAVSPFFLQHLFTHESFERVQILYQNFGFLAVLTAAFTPIPYKVFTIGAGVFGLSFSQFLAASLIGRSARFFLTAFFLKRFGASIKRWIDQYFNQITLLLAILLIGGFLAMQRF